MSSSSIPWQDGSNTVKLATEREVRSVEVLSYGKKLTLECGHAFRMRIFIVNEEMQISDNFSWVEQKNPVEEIRKAGKANDYSKSLTLACSVFEHYGKQILFWYLKKKMMMGDDDVLTPEKVRKLKLHEVIDALACRELITDTDATKMHCIRHLRILSSMKSIHSNFLLKLPRKSMHLLMT